MTQKPTDLRRILEKALVTAFKLGMLDAMGGKAKPNPIPALKEQGEAAHTKIVELVMGLLPIKQPSNINDYSAKEAWNAVNDKLRQHIKEL